MKNHRTPIYFDIHITYYCRSCSGWISCEYRRWNSDYRRGCTECLDASSQISLGPLSGRTNQATIALWPGEGSWLYGWLILFIEFSDAPGDASTWFWGIPWSNLVPFDSFDGLQIGGRIPPSKSFSPNFDVNGRICGCAHTSKYGNPRWRIWDYEVTSGVFAVLRGFCENCPSMGSLCFTLQAFALSFSCLLDLSRVAILCALGVVFAVGLGHARLLSVQCTRWHYGIRLLLLLSLIGPGQASEDEGVLRALRQRTAAGVQQPLRAHLQRWQWVYRYYGLPQPPQNGYYDGEVHRVDQAPPRVPYSITFRVEANRDAVETLQRVANGWTDVHDVLRGGPAWHLHECHASCRQSVVLNEGARHFILTTYAEDSSHPLEAAVLLEIIWHGHGYEDSAVSTPWMPTMTTPVQILSHAGLLISCTTSHRCDISMNGAALTRATAVLDYGDFIQIEAYPVSSPDSDDDGDSPAALPRLRSPSCSTTTSSSSEEVVSSTSTSSGIAGVDEYSQVLHLFRPLLAELRPHRVHAIVPPGSRTWRTSVFIAWPRVYDTLHGSMRMYISPSIGTIRNRTMFASRLSLLLMIFQTLLYVLFWLWCHGMTTLSSRPSAFRNGPLQAMYWPHLAYWVGVGLCKNTACFTTTVWYGHRRYDNLPHMVTTLVWRSDRSPLQVCKIIYRMFFSREKPYIDGNILMPLAQHVFLAIVHSPLRFYQDHSLFHVVSPIRIGTGSASAGWWVLPPFGYYVFYIVLSHTSRLQPWKWDQGDMVRPGYESIVFLYSQFAWLDWFFRNTFTVVKLYRCFEKSRRRPSGQMLVIFTLMVLHSCLHLPMECLPGCLGVNYLHQVIPSMTYVINFSVLTWLTREGRCAPI